MGRAGVRRHGARARLRLGAGIALLALTGAQASDGELVLERFEGAPLAEVADDELVAALVALTADGASSERALTVRAALGWEIGTRWYADAERGAEGREFLAESVGVLVELGDAAQAMRRALWLAGVLSASDEPSEAVRILESALTLPDRDVARPALIHQLVDLVAATGQWERALRLLDDGEASLWGEGDVAALPEEYRDLVRDNHASFRSALAGMRGWIELRLGRPDQGAELILADLAFQTELREDPGRRANFGALAAAHLHRADLRLARRGEDLAVREIEAALADAELMAARPESRALLLTQLGVASLRTREVSSVAESRSRAADAFHRALGEPTCPGLARLSCEVGLAEIDLRDRRLDEAAERIARARVLADTSFGGTRNRQEAALLPVLEARLAAARGAPDVELRRSLDALEHQLAALLDEWRAVEPRSGGLGHTRETATSTLLRETVELTLRLFPGEQGVERALQSVIDVQATSSLNRTLGIGGVDVSDVRRTLAGTGCGLLVYVTGVDDPGFVLAVDEHELVSHPTPSWRELGPAHGEFAAWVQRSPSSVTSAAEAELRTQALERHGATLCEAFLPPAITERTDGWSEVVLVAAAPFENLPWEALPLVGGGTLGTRWAVSRWYSLPLGVELAARRPADEARSPLDLLLVADPPATSVRERVGLTDRELDALTAPFAAQRVLSFLGDDATPSALRQHLPRARVGHVLAHGVQLAGHERFAALALAPDGTHDGTFASADAEALAGQLEHGPTIVLSACSTGAGPARSGDAGTASLGGAFLVAGARAVVLSDTDVSRDATLALMEPFTRALAAGATVAEALRAARSDAAASDAWADPYYHSLVQATGWAIEPVFANSAAAVAPSRASTLGLVALGLAALGLGCGVVLRARGRRRRTTAC